MAEQNNNSFIEYQNNNFMRFIQAVMMTDTRFLFLIHLFPRAGTCFYIIYYTRNRYCPFRRQRTHPCYYGPVVRGTWNNSYN